jgi:electron transfer flavoprotein alpha subunit
MLAQQLGGSVDALVLGPPGCATAAAALGEFGAERIFVAEAEDFAVYHPDAAVRAIVALHQETDYAAILFPGSAMGKDLAPRVAVRVDAGLATEVTGLDVEDGQVVATRPQYAGKAIARLGFARTPAMASLRPNVFTPQPAAGAGDVVAIEVASEPRRARVRGIESGERGRLDVAEASVIVAGGRGLQEPESWSLLEDLAAALGDGVAIGASRDQRRHSAPGGDAHGQGDRGGQQGSGGAHLRRRRLRNRRRPVRDRSPPYGGDSSGPDGGVVQAGSMTSRHAGSVQSEPAAS